MKVILFITVAVQNCLKSLTRSRGEVGRKEATSYPGSYLRCPPLPPGYEVGKEGQWRRKTFCIGGANSSNRMIRDVFRLP